MEHRGRNPSEARRALFVTSIQSAASNFATMEFGGPVGQIAN